MDTPCAVMGSDLIRHNSWQPHSTAAVSVAATRTAPCNCCCVAGSLASLVPGGRQQYPTGWHCQFVALAGRELASMTRNPFDVAGRWVAGQAGGQVHGQAGRCVGYVGKLASKTRNNFNVAFK